jgi:hypothetical protein
MALGVALNQLRQQGQGNTLLSSEQQQRLLTAVRDCGRWVAGRPGIDLNRLLGDLHTLGDEMDDLHLVVHEQLWSVFRMRVALLIVESFIQRYREYFQPVDTVGAPALAH